MSASTVLLIVLIILVAVAAIAAVLFLSNSKSRFTFKAGGNKPTATGSSDNSPDKMFKNRLIGLGVFSGSVIGVLAARLWTMQVNNSEYYSEQADINRTRTITSPAPRGRILDRNGVELVTNRPSLTVTAESDVASETTELNLLSNLLGIPAVAAKRRIQDSTQSALSARTVLIDAPRTTIAFIQEHAACFPNVYVEQRTQRSYPYGEIACHVLGYTGTVTTEQIEASQESNSGITYENGDTTGQAGVEYQYEQVLQGVRGEQTVYIDANGNIMNYSTSVSPESGSDIMLTIDINIQQAAEAALKAGIERAQANDANCKTGACVVLDVTNGDVLAMASAPSFNPQLFVGGISQDDWDTLSNEETGYPMLNRAISGQFPAASTIKPLSALAALDYGIATKETGFYCPGWWTGFGEENGKWCWLHTGHGGIDLRNGITFSCDCVFYDIGKGFYNSDNSDGLQETFRKWGLGSQTGIDLPSEAEGRVPDAEWKWNYFSDYSDEQRTWTGGDYTNIAIGQGDILVTTLQQACVYMGIANGGKVYKPHVLRGVMSRSDDGMQEYQVQVHYEPGEAQENIDLLHDALEGMIYEESESLASHYTNMSIRVAGKTGTGEVGGDDSPTAWMVAYAPANDPKYVVASTIELGGYGSTSSFYVVRDVLGAIYNEPDTSSSATATGD